MEALTSMLGSLFIPVAAAGLLLVVLMVVVRVVKNYYVTVPPNKALVIYGKGGYKLIKGGAVLVWPFFQQKADLDLREINIPDLVVTDAVTAKGAKLTVKAVANIKVGSEDALLHNAVERLLGKSQEEIKKIAYDTLEGHLRDMLGKLTIEEVNSDREAFGRNMIESSQQELAKLGLKIDILTPKELSDPDGYLDAMGMQVVAEVKSRAKIGAAKADREATMQSTTAHREGEVAHQDNLAQEAEAQKKTNVRKADYDAETKAAQAKAEQAHPLATAEARKAVVEREQEVELAKTRKATEVATAEAERKEKELLATTVRPAEAERAAAIATAEGKARAITIEAEANKAKQQLEGEGAAAAIQAKMLAEAAGIKAKLLAEADGILKKAEAYKELNASGQFLQILEAAQTLVPNAIKEFADVMKAAASPLGNADKIVVVDSGGNGSNGGAALERYAGVAPQMVFGLLEKAKALGFDLSGLLDRAGVKADGEAAAAPAGKKS